jgi:CBS domain containing-hemolysin-like protein
MEGSSAATYTELLLLLFLLFLSGFFSSSEVVFFGTNRFLLKKYSQRRFYSLVNRLLSKPREILVSILIGNEIVNVLISAYGTKLFISHLGEKGATISAPILSMLIFTFGEVIPKNVAFPFATVLSFIYAVPFYVVHTLLTPIRLLFKKSVDALVPFDNEEKKPEEVFWEVFDLGYGRGLFGEEEKRIVEKALSIRETTVKEVMTPRPDLFILEEDGKVGEVYPEILRRKHSRVPLYSKEPDNITGVLFVKDIVPFSENSQRSLKEFKRDILIVPEVMPLRNLLMEMRRSNSQIAVVVDEHGQLTGLITLGNILRFLFESFPESWEEDVLQVGKNVYKTYGWVPVENLSKKLGFELPEDYEYDTIGGFAMKHLSKVPEEGDEFEYGGYKFVVDKMEGNRIISLLVVALQEQKV